MKQAIQPRVDLVQKASAAARSRLPQEQAGAPAGRITQLAAMMNGSSSAQGLAQLRDDIQHSPQLQGLMGLAGEINPAVHEPLGEDAVTEDASFEREAD